MNALSSLTADDGTRIVVGSGVIAILSFLLAVSSKVQQLLGPIGKWLAERQSRAIDRQIDIEERTTARHMQQLEAMEREVEFYKTRYESLLEELEQCKKHH